MRIRRHTQSGLNRQKLVDVYSNLMIRGAQQDTDRLLLCVHVLVFCGFNHADLVGGGVSGGIGQFTGA